MANTSLIYKNTVLLYLRSFIVLLISLYASRIILEELGVEDFGIYNAVGGLISMVSFVNTSLLASYQRYYNVVMGEGNKNSLIEWFRASFAAQILLVLAVLLIAESIGLWFLNNKMVISENRLVAANWVYQSSIVAIAFTIIQSPYTAMVTAYEKMNVFAIISVIDAVLKLLIVLVLRFVESDKLIFYSIFIMGISLLDFFLYLIYVERKLDLGSFSILWNWRKIKSLIGFAGYTFFDVLSQTLKSSGINILLNLFFGPVVNAARGIAYQVLTATNQFVQSFQTAFRPQLTKSYAEQDYDFMKRLYYSSSKISFYLILIVTLPIIIETSTILHIWLGNNVPEHTVAFVRLILFTSWMSCFATPSSCIVYASGEMKQFTIWVSGLNLAILPVAYIFLLLGYGPESAMVVSLIITVVVQLIRMLIVRKLVQIGIREYFKEVLLPTMLITVIAFILPVALNAILPQGLLSALVNMMLSVLWTVIVIWLIGVDTDERIQIKNKVMSVIKHG